MSGTATIIQADSRHLPLADNTVDLIVTSPPYFALRSYQDGGEHYAGQVGAEATPAEFVDALIEVTRECLRVLKPAGSLWVNLGDKYAGSGMGGNTSLANSATYKKDRADGYDRSNGRGDGLAVDDGDMRGEELPVLRRKPRSAVAGVPNKSLIGIPWRYALRCIDDLGLILRAEVIWSKPNGLPESVTDRVRRSHEQWFHFVQQPRYFSAVDEIREAHLTTDRPCERISYGAGHTKSGMVSPAGRASLPENPLGKLPGSVWTVPTQPLKVPASLGVDHFAAFPMEWPRRIIQGWSPTAICTVCGEGRRPVTRSLRVPNLAKGTARREASNAISGGFKRSSLSDDHGAPSAEITGYACACPTPDSPTTPAVILDPFGGTGTTALVAKVLGRDGISVDMSSDYCRLAEWRVNDPAQMAAAAQRDKPEHVDPLQMDLFEETA